LVPITYETQNNIKEHDSLILIKQCSFGGNVLKTAGKSHSTGSTERHSLTVVRVVSVKASDQGKSTHQPHGLIPVP
jgi:hypothetical protein